MQANNGNGVSRRQFIVTGSMLLSGGTWAMAQSIRPTAKAGRYLLTISEVKFTDNTPATNSFRAGGSASGSGGFGASSVGPNGLVVTGPNGEFRSNLTIGLTIQAPTKDELLMISSVNSLRAIDNAGNAVETPLSAPIMTMPLTYSQTLATGERPENLYLRIANLGAPSLRSLEGELVITEGKTAKADFSRLQLEQGGWQRAGEVTVALQPVRQNAQTIEVVALVTLPSTLSSPPRFGNPAAMREHFMSMMAKQPVVIAELRDSTGNLHTPRGQTGGAGGGTGNSSFSFGASGGGSRIGGSIAPNQVQRGFSFTTLPGGATPESLTLTVVTRTGPSTRVPFKFENIVLR